MAKVLYLSTKEPELEIVFKRDQKMIVDNTVVKFAAEYIRFLRGPYGGQYETEDPKKQAFIEALDDFKSGLILKVTDRDQLVAKPSAEKVVRGGIDSRPGTKAKPPEEGATIAPKAASVPSLAAEDAPEPETAFPDLPAEEEAEAAAAAPAKTRMF